MNNAAQARELLDKLEESRSLTAAEYEFLLTYRSPELAEEAARKATDIRRRYYGDGIFVRGLIEISNYCKNDCYYCGIRRSNSKVKRYRLQKGDILDCCKEGYDLGFRTFVLQGGEDMWFTDQVMSDIISSIKQLYPDCAVTLSLGERSYESYKALFDAGADRYLLRHETADKAHYGKLHPSEMSYDNRMRCLSQLREIGYQVGCGFMVGSPYQTYGNLASDLKFIESFKPDMCGIGPFVPHHETPFAGEAAGTSELTCFLLSLIRIVCPTVLLPATTALGTIDPRGREKGVLAGANVVMPNLSPLSVRAKYELYDNKLCTGEESAQCKQCLAARLSSVGCHLTVDRGDVINFCKHDKSR